MTTFDVHQHLWPEALLAALRARSEPPRIESDVLHLGEGAFPVDLRQHDLEERLRALDRDGIDVAVVSLPPTLEWEQAPELCEAFHAGILELAQASGGRIRAFAAGACLDGFAGACVSARAVVEGDLGSLPEELERAGQVLFVHPGPPAPPPANAPAWWASVVGYTAQMQAAYAAWIAADARERSALPVVFAILAGGAPIQLERLRSRGVEPGGVLRADVYLDTASYGREALALCVEIHGPGRLLYGSDAPVIDPRPTLAALGELGEDVALRAKSETPARLLG